MSEQIGVPGRRAEKRLTRRKPLSKALRAVVIAGLSASAASQAQELPVPCGACNGGVWVSSGRINSVVTGLPDVAGSTMTINQATQRATLNWQSFNIGRDSTVRFNQPGPDAVALNRIYQNDASLILGRLSANGQVLLINQNGIVFGSGAQVDVNSLTVSTLDVSDEVFEQIGLTRVIDQGAGGAAFVGQSPEGKVIVEAGAELVVDNQGRVLLIGAQVINNGRIVAPEGQVVLAASQDKVYLKASPSDDPSLRGLLVEVDTGGEVVNAGEIAAARGNVTLVGLAVNQSGRVSATTSVRANGSVRLLARDQARVERVGTENLAVANRTGTLSFGPNSLTAVLPETADTATAVDDQPQDRSRIEAMAATVHLRQGAAIEAPGGDVELVATRTPRSPVAPGAPVNDTRILIEQGARIDVSGSEGELLPAERNIVEVELRGNELQDAPVQRDGILRGERIKVDRRVGTPLANIDGALATTPRTIEERTSAGGDIRLSAEGDVVLQAGATLDFSGGQVAYEAGYIETTKLLSEGRVYDIGDADPGRLYEAVAGSVEVLSERWGVNDAYSIFGAGGLSTFSPSYVEGKDAGSLTIRAPAAVLDGTLRGDSVAGPYQRALPGVLGPGGAFARPAGQKPLGGTLRLGTLAGDYGLQRAVRLAATVPPTLLGLDDPLPAGQAVALGVDALNGAGLERLEVNTLFDFIMEPEATLTLQPGGSLKVRALGDVDIGGRVRVAGGEIELLGASPASSLSLRGGARLDVSGLWVNDSPLLESALPDTALALDGGLVELAAASLELARGALVDAGGGAWLDRDGAFTPGDGGRITLTAAEPSAPSPIALDGELRAYALGGGGLLALEANAVRIGAGGTGAPNSLDLAPGFFDRGGFSRFELTANREGLSVAAGTRVAPVLSNARLLEGFAEAPTGTPMNALTGLTQRPEFDRQPIDLRLELAQSASPDATAGVLEVGRGAVLETGVGGVLELVSDNRLEVHGTLLAPAGRISLGISNSAAPIDPGFVADQAIWLSSTARLLAPGATLIRPSDFNPRQGEVFDGGRIALQASRGFIVTEAGSLMDVSARAAELDLPQGRLAYTGEPVLAPRQVHGDAGSVELTAAEGMLLDGAWRAGGVPGVAASAGGTLSVALDSENRGVNGELGFAFQERVVELLPAGEAAGSAGRVPGQAIEATLIGRARLPVDAVAAAGFDALSLRTSKTFDAQNVLRASGRVRATGNLALNLDGALNIESPVFDTAGHTVGLAGSYLSFGDRDTITQAGAPATGGPGRLTLSGEWLDLVGLARVRGADSVVMDFSADARLRGVAVGLSQVITGSLAVGGDLELASAQIYPTTLTDYSIEVPGTARFRRTGTGGQVYSAGGRLSVSAAAIDQGGVLRAPSGALELEAAGAFTARPGSVTSVSADGLSVLFGRTEGGLDWVYPVSGEATALIATPPEKAVAIRARDIDIQDQAVVDLAGGGTLLAHEFFPGPGGSSDILDPALADGAFAILPGLGSDFAPFDTLESAATPFAPGLLVELEGGAGLEAGSYAVLPARYALLPGAYLLRPETGYRDLLPGEALSLLDGTPVLAGRFGSATSGALDARSQGFAIYDAAAVAERAEYRLAEAGEFFAARAAARDLPTPALPADAGRLSLAASRAVALAGRFLTAPDAGGRGAAVDLQSAALSVVDQVGPASGEVQLRAAELNALGASSLLLGGVRTVSGEGLEVDVAAEQVRVADGAELKGPEVILAARDRVELAPGATVTAEGASAAGPSTLNLEGDGALLRASTAPQVEVRRSGASGAGGTLSIARGAVVQTGSGGSITLDATGQTELLGSVSAPGGALSLGAERIGLGELTGNEPGLLLSTAELAALAGAGLRLSASASIDFYGSLDLQFGDLLLDSAALLGFGGPDSRVSLQAGSLVLQNSHGATATAGLAGGQGTLALRTGPFELGPGSVLLDGFQSVALSAAGGVTGRGEGALHSTTDLDITAPWVTAEGGARTGLSAAGRLALDATQAVAAPVSGLAAELELSADRVVLDTALLLPAGKVTLRSRAPGESLSLLSGARIDVSGVSAVFADKRVDVDGGRIGLSAEAGDIALRAGASLALDGGGQGAAGLLRLSAPAGTLNLDGELSARSASAGRGGQAEIDVLSLSEIGTLGSVLAAGGFDARQDWRIRSGDVTMAAGGRLTARELSVRVEDGALSVGGLLNTRGLQGGRLRLYARDDLTLLPTALISTRGIAPGETGGRLELGTSSGRLDLNPGILDMRGGAGAPGGVLALRAPREGAGVAVDRLPRAVLGNPDIELEAFQVYEAGRIDSALISTLAADTTAYMAGADAIAAGLGQSGNPRFQLRPGIEVRSSGELSLASAWDLADWRYDGAPGVLSLRAAGDLRLERNLSDGFGPAAIDTPFGTFPVSPRLLDGEAWSYRLVGGADLAAADPLQAGTTAGDVLIGRGVSVHTGAGDIEVVASGDVLFGDAASTLYSAGRADAQTPYGSFGALQVAFAFGAQYPVDGGRVSIDALGDIRGSGSTQFFTDWYHRMGQWNPANTNHAGETPTAWGIAFEHFRQGVGAFGGGDLRLRAGGDIEALSAVMPTVGRQEGRSLSDFDFLYADNQVEVIGGGRMQVQAGGDLLGGSFLLGAGEGTLSAGGRIGAAGGGGLAPVLALGEANLDLLGARGAAVEAVVNATAVPQSPLQFESAGLFRSFFWTYGEQASVNVSALTGEVRLQNDIARLQSATTLSDNLLSAESAALQVYPGSLTLAALGGNVHMENSFRMYPSPRGSLDILARQDVTTGAEAAISINFSDADPALLPGPANPTRDYQASAVLLNPSSPPGAIHAPTPVHRGAVEPVRMIALEGDIAPAVGLRLDTAKRALISAGRDVRDVNLRLQNVDPTDVSVVQAGRDISFADRRNAQGVRVTNSNGILIAGPGRLDVLAGRNIQLAASEGIRSLGDQLNPVLADTGAGLTVAAGLAGGVDYAAFTERYLTQAEYAAALEAFTTQQTGQSFASSTDALRAFRALPLSTRRGLITEVLYAEVRAGGEAGSSDPAGFDRARTAIDTLFPEGAPAGGDLDLVFSTIRTQDGGDIGLLVPRGEVNVGLAVAVGSSKEPSELGIVVQSSGDLNAVVRDDFLVNQSRVFALDGGDIMIWSSLGDIDAGRGAKTAISAPPPVVTIDESGNTRVEFPPAVSGSGIRAAVSTPGREPGSVFLFAPSGVVDAGDAGIGSGGNITIAAVEVVGADNIDAGGVSVGVPSVDTGGLSIGLVGVGDVAANATSNATEASERAGEAQQAAAAAASMASAGLSLISVEVLGFGEETI